VVKEVFQKNIHTKVDWDMETGGFEAEFKLNDKEVSRHDKRGHSYRN
jgi:hypothetical protein